MDVLDWLMDGCEPNTEGDWKHAFILDIGTLEEDTGWFININFVNTPYEKISFDDIKIERTESDWITCEKSGGYLYCDCGVRNLKKVLTIIKKWMTDKQPSKKQCQFLKVGTLEWLMDWYESNFSACWHYSYDTGINSVDSSQGLRVGWYFRLPIDGTPYENIPFEKSKIDRSDSDWIYYDVNKGVLTCYCGPKNLKEALDTVKKWMSDNKPTVV